MKNPDQQDIESMGLSGVVARLLTRTAEVERRIAELERDRDDLEETIARMEAARPQ